MTAGRLNSVAAEVLMLLALPVAILGTSPDAAQAQTVEVALFEGQAQSAPATSPKLEGTAWQLVEFQSGDGSKMTPDVGANYTIEFPSVGTLNVRIDCNRGRGSWKSSGPNQLEIGPLVLTRALCPQGSLHDRIVKLLGYVRSYIVRDGHLYLSLMADGGIFEFEPLRRTP